MTDRKKPGVAFWATVALVVVLVGYPLGIGPAIWLYDHDCFDEDGLPLAALRWLYGPLKWLDFYGPQPVRDALDWYESLWQ